MNQLKKLPPLIFLIGVSLYLLVLFLGSIMVAIGSNELAYWTIGMLSVGIFGLSLVLLPIFMDWKLEEISEKISKIMKSIAVEDITPIGPVVAMRPAILRLKIRNPLKTYGLRLRFRSYDYINPSSMDLLLEPGETTVRDIIIVPSGSGKREFSVTIAPLYDENNRYIPEHEADDVALQKFSIDVEEAVAGGLSSRERSIISGLIKFAAFFSASGLVYLSILKFSGMESLVFVLTQVVPIVTILQVPVLMLIFYLDKKLPEKPTFVFEEEG